MLERRDRESGAVFEASKTTFVHFTRKGTQGRDVSTSLQFKDNSIRPGEAIKLLGVVFDQGLRFKLHVSKAANRA